MGRAFEGRKPSETLNSHQLSLSTSSSVSKAAATRGGCSRVVALHPDSGLEALSCGSARAASRPRRFPGAGTLRYPCEADARSSKNHCEQTGNEPRSPSCRPFAIPRPLHHAMHESFPARSTCRIAAVEMTVR